MPSQHLTTPECGVFGLGVCEVREGLWALGEVRKCGWTGKDWGDHPSYGAQHEQMSEEGKEAGQGGQKESPNGEQGARDCFTLQALPCH